MKKSELRKIVREAIKEAETVGLGKDKSGCPKNFQCKKNSDCAKFNDKECGHHECQGGCCMRGCDYPKKGAGSNQKNIKEQIKDIARNMKRDTISINPNFKHNNFKGKFPTKATKQNIGIEPDIPTNLPNYGSSSAFSAYYVCGYLPYPDGNGAGCYGVGSNGIYTSPHNGASYFIPCTPWHQGGSCFGFLDTNDIPSNLQGIERACNQSCVHS